MGQAEIVRPLPGRGHAEADLTVGFDLPRGTVFPIGELDIRLDPSPHPMELSHGDAIAAHWRAEKERSPSVFDGTVVLFSRLVYRGGRLEGLCHPARYSTFLYWRATRMPGAEHAYAHAVLAGAEGDLVAIRMGAHTSNPRRVYFAAGSFEPEDFPGGRVDVDFNMRREVLEETGLDLDETEREAALHGYSIPEGTVLFRRFHSGLGSGTLADAIARFVAADAGPEIEGPVVMTDADRRPEGLMPHMPALIDWHFSTRRGRSRP
jgi:8-oxo-dGTP pyrophosphatase MutT (NUDIX family)